jgi:hypothetical protein
VSSRDTPQRASGSGTGLPRRAWPFLTVVAVVALGAAAVGFSHLGSRSSPLDVSPPVTRTSQPAFRLRLTEVVLQRQAQAVSNRDEAGYLAGWDSSPDARRQAALTYSNLRKLGVARLETAVPVDAVTGNGSSWTAAVAVTWGLTGLDPNSSDSTLRYSFSENGGAAVISRIAAPPGGRTPIWLLHGLRVRRDSRTLVAATGAGEADRVERLLRSAVGAVGKVLPGWHGDLVAYAPGDLRQFNALIAARPGQYRGIAAVTTIVDGSLDASAPAAIVINPRVFDPLGPISAHVVVTHEATHAATHAAAVSMPLWVAEGFADYVGIGSVDVPTAVAAGAALRVVRRSGSPATLPSDDAFAVGGSRLEATYEEAWLANSLIAKTYGQRRLVDFYRKVEARPQRLAHVFVTVLGTSESAFTRSWRTYLQGLAGAG